MCDINLVEKAKEKVFKILNVINKMMSNMKKVIISKYYKIEQELLTKIIIENNIDLDKIKDIDNMLAKTQKPIKIDEFNDTEKYYSILYDDYFLPKIYTILANKANLFRTFNEAYYYKKFIKYISSFLKKYPVSLSDDIIKEKIFEVINCLDSNDKLYTYDFYFYLSIMDIKKSYNENVISISEFEPLDFENCLHISRIFSEIFWEKVDAILCLNDLVEINHPKSQLMKYIKNVEDENKDYLEAIKNLEVHNQVISSTNFCLELFTESEKKLMKYIQENESDEAVAKLLNYLKDIPDVKEKFEFYYMGKKDTVLSLNKEYKYLIFHSYQESMNISKREAFYQHALNYIEQIKSYEEGIEKDLKEEIKEIIESKDFFSLIRGIYNSDIIKEYCKNPVQYLKELNSQKVDSYSEKDISSRKKKDRIVSNFTIDKKGGVNKNSGANDCDKNDNNEKDAIPELKDDLLFEPFVDEKILNDILEENDIN